MERTIPSTASEEVELYLRTYYSLLRSTAEVQIRTLEGVHAGMNSLLHPHARDSNPDMSAFIYSLLRLPECISQTTRVVLGQSAAVFAAAGYPDVFRWREVTAIARRRRCFYDGRDTMACLIASRSDIDDMVPLLTAFQIEWNKLHYLLQRLPKDFPLEEGCKNVNECRLLADTLEISVDDLDRLYAIWDEHFGEQMARIAARESDLRIQLLNGSLTEYRRATHSWWNNIEKHAPEIYERPVYFVSSNVHSMLNVLTGFALQQEQVLGKYLEEAGDLGLLNEWRDLQMDRVRASKENFLYYVYKKFRRLSEAVEVVEAQAELEANLSVRRIDSSHYFDVEAQVVDLAKLDVNAFDPRLNGENLAYLANSNALILNIDYPLGLAAYNILSEVAERAGHVLGVYVMGKAATLNSTIGDVMIPNVVHDEHSQNTFLFNNCITAADVTPFLLYGTVLDNQKAVTVQGTFLQNADYMDVFYREGYTDIEMESGPYLSAIYEMYRPKRHPVNEIVNLYGIDFDLGIVHYASDTPLSKGRNLGAGNLSYFGMDSTYAATLAILRRIFWLEKNRLPGGR